MGGPPTGGRVSTINRYYEHPEPHRVRPHYGVVTDRYKLVHFHGSARDYSELFELALDPDKPRDVLVDPGRPPVREQLESELARLRRDLRVPANSTPEMLSGAKPARTNP